MVWQTRGELVTRTRPADFVENLACGHPGPPSVLACAGRPPEEGTCLMMMDDHRLAHDLAAQAGELLLALRADGGDPRELRDAGDRRSHEFLASQLSQLRPGDAVLSEEGRDDPARLAADRVWIVDPLDGTREFGEPDRTDWAVHVALWERGALTAGAVALPARGRVLSTAQPPAAPPAPAPGAPVRVLVSRTRPPAFLDRLAGRIELALIPMGSA